MSRLSKLITELCPDGVQYATLGQIASFRKGATKARADMQEGPYPVVAGGLEPAFYCNEFNRAGETIAVSSSGVNAGFVSYWNSPIMLTDAFSVEPDEEVVVTKYLYYALTNMQLRIFSKKKGAGVPHVYSTDISTLRIPLPPLAIQHEIVRVLDQFTGLITELEAELAARKRQYEYYRELMLTFDETVSRKPLGEICVNHDSRRVPIKASQRKPGPYPYFGASGVIDYIDDYLFDGHYLLVSEDGANLVSRVTPIAFSISGKTWVNNHAHVLEFENHVTRRFVEFYLNAVDLSAFLTTAAQPKLNQANLNRIPVPFPPLPDQERVVSILDRFEALVNDLSSGIPAEIEARRKQYEYYRDKLLSFKEAKR